METELVLGQLNFYGDGYRKCNYLPLTIELDPEAS